jgi:hypothetical protein
VKIRFHELSVDWSSANDGRSAHQHAAIRMTPVGYAIFDLSEFAAFSGHVLLQTKKSNKMDENRGKEMH